MLKKPKKLREAPFASSKATESAVLTSERGIRYVSSPAASQTVPYTIQIPTNGEALMSDRAYVLINVLPGQTTAVVRSLSDIKEIKTIDPCWGKPDIIVVVEVPDQDALTQLVLTKIHSIEGVAQTDTHLVYRLKESKQR